MRQFGYYPCIFAVVLALAGCIPQMNQQRIKAQEMSALRSVQTLHAAQVQFFSQFGRFAASLQELGPPASGAPSAAAADLIPAALASGTANGYVFTVKGEAKTYTVTAAPSGPQGTAGSSFFSDQSMVIHKSTGPEPATAASPALQ